MEFSIEIGLIILFALLSGVLSVRFRIPTVLGLIFIGALVGNLNLIKDHKLLDIVLEIGAILLLFTVGIEFNLEKLKKFGLSKFKSFFYGQLSGIIEQIFGLIGFFLVFIAKFVLCFSFCSRCYGFCNCRGINSRITNRR
ncbi:MAG: cation:proton antiporter [Candidatus Woesearchaeota archaeon]